jgi:glycine cleavage system H lipoate-binding protein
MMKNICITLLLASLLLLSGCDSRPPAASPAVIRVVRDTVTAVDSAAVTLQIQAAHTALKAKYQREKRENDSIYSQNQYVYLQELVKMDSIVEKLQDSVLQLKVENRKMASEIEQLRGHIVELTPAPAPVIAEPAYINSMRERSEWLLKQERKIYTVGVDDKAAEVEITRTYIDDKLLYVAVSIEDAQYVTAAMNNIPSLFFLKRGKDYIFVFSTPGQNQI